MCLFEINFTIHKLIMMKEIETTWASKNIFSVLRDYCFHDAGLRDGASADDCGFLYHCGDNRYCFGRLTLFRAALLRFNKSLFQVPLVAAVFYALFQIIPFGSLAETAGVAEFRAQFRSNRFGRKSLRLHIFALAIFLAALLTFIDSAKRMQKNRLVDHHFRFCFAFFAILQAVLSPNKIYGIYEVPYADPFGSFVNRHNFAAYMEMTIAVPLGLMFVGAIAERQTTFIRYGNRLDGNRASFKRFARRFDFTFGGDFLSDYFDDQNKKLGTIHL